MYNIYRMYKKDKYLVITFAGPSVWRFKTRAGLFPVKALLLQVKPVYLFY